MYETRKTLFCHIFKYLENSLKYDSQGSIFGKLQSVWKRVETLFYIPPKSKLKLRRNRRTKIVKIYANQDQLSKHRHGHGFLCLNLMNY